LKAAIAKEKAWLEEIKDAKGNTEANSLKQAERINQSGIINLSLTEIVDEDNLGLNDIIRLHLPASDNMQNAKTYTYAQLTDLQDKLTLVVGKLDEHQDIIRYYENVMFFYFSTLSFIKLEKIKRFCFVDS